MPLSKERDGLIGQRDFRGGLIREHEACIHCGFPRPEFGDDDPHHCGNYEGMALHSEVTIWKDPVTAMQRTKAIGLLYKQLRKDSAMSRQGIADYLITMRKPGDNPDPVRKFSGSEVAQIEDDMAALNSNVITDSEGFSGNRPASTRMNVTSRRCSFR